MNTPEEFWRLCRQVVVILNDSGDYKKTEPLLLTILDLVKQHPDERDFFSSAFKEMLRNPRTWTTLIVQFCMRELRYPEVQAEALKIQQSLDDEAIHDDARRVLEAYGNVWLPGHIFDYYKEKEPPIAFTKIPYSRARYFYFRVKGILKRLFSRPDV